MMKGFDIFCAASQAARLAAGINPCTAMDDDDVGAMAASLAAMKMGVFELAVPRDSGCAHQLHCQVLPHKLLVAGLHDELVCRSLDPLLRLLCFPSSASTAPKFVAYSRTDGDVSLVVDEGSAALLEELDGALMGSPVAFCAIEVFEGSSALEMTGLIATLSKPLADANLGLLYLSTYNTDLLLVEQQHLARAVACLSSRFPVNTDTDEAGSGTNDESKGSDPSTKPATDHEASTGAAEPATGKPARPRGYSANFDADDGDSDDWRAVVARDAASYMDLSAERGAPELFAACMPLSSKDQCCAALLKSLFFAPRGDDGDDPFPFRAFVQTEKDISLLLPKPLIDLFPADCVQVHEAPWRSVHIAKGAVPFADSRLVSLLALTLADAAVPIYYFSTHANDFVLVERAAWSKAVSGLKRGLGTEVEFS